MDFRERGVPADAWTPTRPAPAPVASATEDKQPATPPAVTQLRTDRVRFSQTTVSGPTHLHGAQIALPGLVESFRRHGYTSEPIQVVRMPDGGLTSLDNRRLWAAQRAGLEFIPAIVRDPSDPFYSPRQQDHLKLKKELIDKDGELGPPGAVLFPAKQKPQTVCDAVVFRCGRQGRTASGQPLPLFGSLEAPRYTGEKWPVNSPDIGNDTSQRGLASKNGKVQLRPGADRRTFRTSQLRGRGRRGDLER